MATTYPDRPSEAAVPGDDDSARSGRFLVAAAASLAAGAIHAAAIGAHGDHGDAVAVFTALAIAQLGWGAAILAWPRRALLVVGLLVQGVALGGWALTKTVGIGFVDGFEASEPVQRADGLAALLAVVAVLAIGHGLLRGPAPVRRGGALAGGAFAGVVVVAAGVLAVVGMTGVVGHDHAEEGDHAHGDGVLASDDHPDGDHPAGDHASGDHETTDHGVPAVVPPRPYDPELPIDLSGVDGVTPQQQAQAENLIAVTLDRLPNYADTATAEADGFRSIGDGLTGHEHYINWEYIDDEHVLNPDYPESLVYEVGNGRKTLVSAMFMLPRGTTLDDVPELGGPLTQWHIHDDLCFSDNPDAPRVVGVTSVGGECRGGLVKFDPVPMIHVWITPHACGPFAALEGVGAGQVAEGEEHLCNHTHGTGS